MRRKDREVTDIDKINSIIDACQCCRLGFYDSGEIYIVPINFGHTYENGKHAFYFHGAKEGRKIDLIAKNHYAGFELDTNYKLNTGTKACEYSARFQSIIGSGDIEFIEHSDEKKEALNIIMKHNTGKDKWEYSDEMLNAVCIFKLEANKISCKEHL